MLTNFLIERYQKNGTIREEDQKKLGNQASIIGMALNIILAVSKMLAGVLFHSVAVLADGINNLSDSGNALILLISFRLSSKPADKEHPFGHERYEYLASMVVGASILMLSFEMFKSSLDKILHPQPITASFLVIGVLIFSILVKLWLGIFYRRCADAIHSTVLKASSADSFNDVISTGAVLLSTIIAMLFSINLDGYMGIIVAVLILKTGLEVLKEAANKILGEAPDAETVANIENKILSYPGVCGIHDFMMHSYGPNRTFVSVHVEVDSKVDVLESHDMIDRIEQDFLKNENIHMVVHMDPIVLDNPKINQLYDEVKNCIRSLSEELQIHDFRAVIGPTHTNLIFDCVIPYSCSISSDVIQKAVDQLLSEKEETYYSVITFERPYN